MKRLDSGLFCGHLFVIALHKRVYARLAYKGHFIFAGCYDNDPWYLVTNLAGHLDLAGFFSKCPANDRERESPSLNIMCLPGLEHALLKRAVYLGQFRGQKSLGPLKISLEMAHKVICPQTTNNLPHFQNQRYINSYNLC